MDDVYGLERYYKKGNVTLTEGSVEFTVSDEADIGSDNGAHINSGDELYLPDQKRWLKIASIVDNSSGKLAYPCPEGCGGTFPLKIKSRLSTPLVSERVLDLIDIIINNKNLRSIARIEAKRGDILQAADQDEWRGVSFNPEKTGSDIKALNNSLEDVAGGLKDLSGKFEATDSLLSKNLRSIARVQASPGDILQAAGKDEWRSVSFNPEKTGSDIKALNNSLKNVASAFETMSVQLTELGNHVKRIDPVNKKSDAFSMGNMVETENALILKTSERTAIRQNSNKLSDIDLECLLPAGIIAPFATQAPPKGWLACNGSAISRKEYSQLFSVIGTSWGGGDKAETFNLPDLRGEFLRGWDNGRGIDQGRNFASPQGDAIRNLTGSINTGDMYGASLFTKANGVFSVDQGTHTNWRANTQNINVPNAGETVVFDVSRANVPVAQENRPRNVAVLYCIKY